MRGKQKENETRDEVLNS